MGKTKTAIDRLVSQKCKTLFITERIDSFSEVETAIRKAIIEEGTSPIVRSIHADALQWSNSVAREIEELPDFYRHNDHVIVIATHAAMLRCDFSQFSGWQIVVDEVPQLLDFEKRKTHLDAAFFQTYYRLEPLDRGWTSVTLTKRGEKLT
ncbi:MAG TPA: hypothetical protein VHQ01_05650, partial [Pyrinomonadaceae bacterium]|nr:hypothetical protein [Pyrinomonadaceae bacterium]